MTFPSVTTSSSFADTSNQTSHTVTLPSGVTTGDLLLLFVYTDAFADYTSPSGYTLRFDGTGQSGIGRLKVFSKVAGGSESNPSFTTGSDAAAAVMYRIANGGDILVGPGNGYFGDLAPDPKLLDATEWSGDDVLWIAVAGWDQGRAISTYPSSYSGNNVSANWDDSNGVGIAVGTRNLVADTENPGTFADRKSVV